MPFKQSTSPPLGPQWSVPTGASLEFGGAVHSHEVAPWAW
jgi:hypothetical protein